MRVIVGDANAIWVKSVLFDGEDVTNRCTAADSDEGWVRVFEVDPVTNIPIGYPPETEVHHGAVQIEMKP